MGDVVSIVGPTGSGKTTLINDIELFADGDTPSGPADADQRRAPAARVPRRPAQEPDRADHAAHHVPLRPAGPRVPARPTPACAPPAASARDRLVERTIDFANQLTGEPIDLDMPHDGALRRPDPRPADRRRHRHLQHADRAAGRGGERRHPPHAGLELLRQHRKIFIFVTHDPRIALLSDYRIVMQSGRITNVLETNEAERELATRVSRLDDVLSRLREKLRLGERAQRRTNWKESGMKLAICAGPPRPARPPSCATSSASCWTPGHAVAFLKIDVQYADEDELLAAEFGIPTRKVYSGELCPDHCNVMVLGDALSGPTHEGCDVLLVETAGLCLRCSPYVDGGLGVWSCSRPPAA